MEAGLVRSLASLPEEGAEGGVGGKITAEFLVLPGPALDVVVGTRHAPEPAVDVAVAHEIDECLEPRSACTS